MGSESFRPSFIFAVTDRSSSDSLRLYSVGFFALVMIIAVPMDSSVMSTMAETVVADSDTPSSQWGQVQRVKLWAGSWPIVAHFARPRGILRWWNSGIAQRRHSRKNKTATSFARWPSAACYSFLLVAKRNTISARALTAF